MIAKVDIAEYLELSRTNLTIDVRSEGEFKYGHKPGSMNIPLFDNEERKVVGTLYKEKGKNEALLAGLDFAGKKMMYSRYSWVRRMWWVPQTAGTSMSLYAGVHNTRLVP